MNGTLYCNYKDIPQQFWIGNFSAYKAQADARWTKYYGGLRGSGPMNDACFAADGNTCRKECGYCGPSSNSNRMDGIGGKLLFSDCCGCCSALRKA